jgi:hypothetical protein
MRDAFRTVAVLRSAQYSAVRIDASARLTVCSGGNTRFYGTVFVDPR